MPEPSLYIASPCYGGLASAGYMRALLALQTACAARGVGFQADLGGGEALISRARAGMLTRFLASTASHLLFVDGDIGFAPQDVFRLLDCAREVAGAPCPSRRAGADLEVGEPLATETSDGFQQVDWIGAGFLMIRRDAGHRIESAFPTLRAGLGDVRGGGASSAVMMFDSFIEPGSGRYLSDGHAFCRRWRDIGGEVWADGRARLVRTMRMDYSGDPQSQAGPRP